LYFACPVAARSTIRLRPSRNTPPRCSRTPAIVPDRERVQPGTPPTAALLDDVVEDSPWTFDALRAEGFSEEVVAAVDGLTRREGETYDDFIARGATNPLARRVKLADIEDNMDLRRLEEIGEKDLERLQRYQRARKVILAAMGIS
jgi:hypothetical protein